MPLQPPASVLPERSRASASGGSGLPLAGIRGLLILWMFVLSAIAYVDRVNISIAGQAIAKDFSLSNLQLGWVFSAFVLGYAFCQAPAGRLGHRLRPRPGPTHRGLS